MSKRNISRLTRKGSGSHLGLTLGKIGRMNLLGLGSIVAIVILGLVLVSPTVNEETHASSCLDNPTSEECVRGMAETEFSLTSNTAISLSMDSNVDLELTPTSTGTTGVSSTRLSVSTNSKDGYALYMQTGSSTGDLENIASSIGDKIKNTSLEDVTLANLERNSYGYALTSTKVDDSTTYSKLPTTGSIIHQTSTVSNLDNSNYAYGDTYYLSFGVKLGTDVASGTYSGDVLVSAVANPKTLTTMFDLTYMQDMNSDICANTREHYTKRLTDSRDGKEYWVAKLKDGNCWMTQNLALTFGTGAGEVSKLTSDDSDLNSKNEWLLDTNLATPETDPNGMMRTTETIIPNIYDPSVVNTRSWNLGQWIYATPTATTECINASSLSDCMNVGFVNVDNEQEFQPGYKAQIGAWNTNSNSELIAVNCASWSGDVDGERVCTSGQYDEHYLVGNYYQYNAVTAGSGSAVVNGDATDSICPKNWKLAVAGPQDNDKSGSFRNLVTAYGLINRLTSAAGTYTITLPNGSSKSETVAQNQYSIVSEPLYYVRVGSIFPGSKGGLNYAGASGYYRSATGANKIWEKDGFGTYLLYLYHTGSTTPYGPTDRNSGNAVRCLAR